MSPIRSRELRPMARRSSARRGKARPKRRPSRPFDPGRRPPSGAEVPVGGVAPTRPGRARASRGGGLNLSREQVEGVIGELNKAAKWRVTLTFLPKMAQARWRVALAWVDAAMPCAPMRFPRWYRWIGLGALSYTPIRRGRTRRLGAPMSHDDEIVPERTVWHWLAHREAPLRSIPERGRAAIREWARRARLKRRTGSKSLYRTLNNAIDQHERPRHFADRHDLGTAPADVAGFFDFYEARKERLRPKLHDRLVDPAA